MSAAKRHFWEGRDSAGRRVRAFFAETNVSGLAFVVPGRMRLPVIIFRVLRDWKADAYMLAERQSYVEAANEMNRRYGKKLWRMPKPNGSTWVVASYVELTEAQQCRKYKTGLGLELKFRPSMARLTSDQLSELFVALDVWLESGGKQPAQKQPLIEVRR